MCDRASSTRKLTRFRREQIVRHHGFRDDGLRPGVTDQLLEHLSVDVDSIRKRIADDLRDALMQLVHGRGLGDLPALEALETNDAVVGPSIDGGFYLLGVRRCQRGLFCLLPWSTNETYRALKTKLSKEKFRISELETLFDVDTPDDLAVLEEYLSANPSSAQATRAWCFEMKCA